MSSKTSEPIHDSTVYDVPVDELTEYPGNPRRGDVQAIAQSLNVNGQYRPVVVWRETNQVLAGNHTLKAARSLGWNTIKATYVDGITAAQASRIVLADNRVSDLADYDPDDLADLLSTLDGDIAGTGYTDFDVNELLDEIDLGPRPEGSNSGEPGENPYTSTIQIPIYEVVGDKPALSELIDDTRTRDLHAAIDKADIPDEVKAFLRQAAERHTVFNYRKIAEYYPHASAKIQRLMESSALVIVDVDDAIANGWAQFQDRLLNLHQESVDPDA